MSEQNHPELPKELLTEKALLFACKTNRGFLQRLVTQFMPRLRQHPATRNFISKCEKKICQDDDLRKQAYDELDHALTSVKKILKDLENQGLTVYFEGILSASAYEDITNRVVENLGKQDSMTPFEKNPISNAYDDIIHDVCAEGSILTCKSPPYARVYYKIRTLYVNHISKSWEIDFAPSALHLIKQDRLINFQAAADCDPAYLWAQLMLIERAWPFVDTRVSIQWQRIEAPQSHMWLKADDAFREAYRNWAAGQLRLSDDPDYQNEFFTRKHTEFIVERILYEVELKMISIKPTDTPKRKNPRTQEMDADVQTLVLFAKQSWVKLLQDNNPIKIGHEKVARDLLNNLPKSISLYVGDQIEDRLPRAEKAAKMTDPRIYKGGRCVGLKPHWQNFDWVNGKSVNQH